eukprot:14919948-Heterocapsa_arctica.AAC.1
MNQCSDAAICSRMCIATCGATGASELSARLASPTRRPWSLDLFVRTSRPVGGRIQSRVTDAASCGLTTRAASSLMYSFKLLALAASCSISSPLSKSFGMPSRAVLLLPGFVPIKRYTSARLALTDATKRAASAAFSIRCRTEMNSSANSA